MNIIFSRKGFDSKYGVIPSPILPDGRMISLPIPNQGDLKKYSDIPISNIDGIMNYCDLIKSLSGKNFIFTDNTKINLDDAETHLDPDIYNYLKIKDKDWCPLFGQYGTSQNHLINKDVQTNDIFLFFGTFQKTILNSGNIMYDKNFQPIHAIFGYFQINKSYTNNEIKSDSFPEWAKQHPHYKYSFNETNQKNCIYIANKVLSFNQDLSGADFFKFSENLILTAEKLSKSKWSLPSFFQDVKISYHSDNSWKVQNGIDYFQSANIGQEFVINDATDDVINWVNKLINENNRDIP